MKRILFPLLAALALSGTLAGCGSSGEDFALEVSPPIQAVYGPLGNVGLPAEFSVLFPGLKVDRERTSDKEVVYSIPGDGSEPARIALRFETGAGGKGTIVHATIDVPTQVIQVEGKPQIISEFKVRKELESIIKAISAENTIEGSASVQGDAARNRLGALLGALAIATDKAAIARVEKMLKDPDSFAAALEALGGSFYDDADQASLAGGDAAMPDSDPEAALRQEKRALERSESEEQEQFNAASAAGDRAVGAATEPDSAF